jgi:hypothetical protein
MQQRIFKEHSEEESEKDRVLNINSRFAIQESPENKGVHAHALIEIEHKTCIRLSRIGIKEFILNHNEELPEVKGVYVNIKLVSASIKNVLSYVRRDEPLQLQELNDAYNKLKL